MWRDGVEIKKEAIKPKKKVISKKRSNLIAGSSPEPYFISRFANEVPRSNLYQRRNAFVDAKEKPKNAELLSKDPLTDKNFKP